ncbi:MAG: metal-dependent transcriptional regulator [Candidatus Omnitrophica bacterium]|nr:metal-dependent transcriptional regulator [Candidatus Omnitrophota bacterium]
MVEIAKDLTSNMEDYLEAIYALKKEKGFTRVGAIAKRLNVKNSSVNSALKTLSEKGLAVHERYGYVGLTKEGDKIALEVQNKHDILFRFLTEFLMLDEKVAGKEACGIEHAISKKTSLRLTKFFQFLELGLNGVRPRLLRNFERYLKTGKKMKCYTEK